MTDTLLLARLDDDDDDEVSDHDFEPDNIPGNEESDQDSTDEDDGTRPNAFSARIKAKNGNNLPDIGFDNSGDELTITEGSRRKKKKRKKSKTKIGDGDLDGDEDGGLIKTRAQRKVETVEKRPLVDGSKASVDVDTLFASMDNPVPPSELSVTSVDPNLAFSSSVPMAHSSLALPTNDEDTVTIKRKYTFAGKVLEEDRTVPASSKEAKQYLQRSSQQHEVQATDPKAVIRRPMKRKALWDPATIVESPTASNLTFKAPKLNTLEKSKLDWAAHVDTQGIGAELSQHRRAKDTYLGRVDFLADSDAKRAEQLKSLKPK